MKTLSDLINDAHMEIPKVKYSDLVETKDVYILCLLYTSPSPRDPM